MIFRQLAGRDHGSAIVLLSAVVVLLLGLAAFAVDLGWLWVNASRVQNAADAAALSGVTHLPADAVQAQTSAEAAALANGYVMGGGTSLSSSVGIDNSLNVTLTTPVDTFFLRVLGQDQVTISRAATAQYILPVRLGSNINRFGVESDNNFWASINGEFTDYEDGDAYATSCIVGGIGDSPDNSCDTGPNGEYRSGGYYLAVEVAPGTPTLSVEIYNAAFYDGSPETGEYLLPDSNNGPRTTYSLYPPDSTPYDVTDLGASVCSLGVDAEQAGYTDWVTLCTISPTPGIYTLQIETDGGGTFNNFAVRAPQATAVYGLGDISIYSRVSAGTTRVDLAEIPDVHAGKTLIVGLFDPGDSTGNGTISVVAPGTVPSSCRWRVRGTATWTNSCTIDTVSAGGPSQLNGSWVDWEIEIPGAYTCTPAVGPGCFWSLDFTYSAVAHDRTVWSARVVGNPVRLVVG